MKPKSTLRTGVILLIVSQLLGWGAFAVFCYLTLKTGDPIMSFFGVGLYAASWGGRGLAVMLAGKEGIFYVRDFLKKRVISLFLRRNGPHKGGNP